MKGRRIELLLSLVLLQVFVWSTVALAQSCRAPEVGALKALTEAEFFQLPIGAVALGSGCNERGKTCKLYHDISNCTDLTFPVALSGRANRLYLVFNTMSRCGATCEWVDSVLQLIVLYPPDAAAIEYKPFVDLFRNYSARWGVYQGREDTRLKCCDQPDDAMLKPEDYIVFDGLLAQENLLFTRTNLSWHSVFRPSYRQEGAVAPLPIFSNYLSPSDGQSDMLTWKLRDFFRDRLAGCPGCSAKLMMTRFQEVEATPLVQQPLTPLFQAFNVMTYNRIRVEARAPLSEGVYDTAVTIDILRD